MSNINDYKIRKTKPDDVLALHNIYLKTWLDTYPNKEFNITTEDIIFKYESRLTPEIVEERKKKIAQIGENELMLVVEKGSKLVGLCNTIQKENSNEIQAIYILPEYQRLGLGVALWKEAQKIFNPEKETVVHVASYNTKAINFYKKLGFQSTGKTTFSEFAKMRNGAVIPELEMIIKKQPF